MSSPVTATSSSPVQYDAIAALEAKTSLVPFKYTPSILGANDVEISIHACGVCHTDLHQCNNDWKMGMYPMIPGHEIIGDVIAIGSAVTEIKLGQMVGITPQISSCGTCKECMKGETQMCPKKTWIGFPKANGDMAHGGFSSHIRVNEHWAFPIPDNLSAVGAAPLLCAGITVWSPLSKLGPKHRVGIIGVGGLGHLGIMFASKLGCKVTGISTSIDKKAEVLKFGAHTFLNSSDAKEMAAAAGTFDYLLSTVASETIDWNQYIALLDTDGVLCAVGATTFNVSSFKLNRVSLTGSAIASNGEVRAMLAFCGKHNIVAQTEEREMTLRVLTKRLLK